MKKQFETRYGYFANEGREFVITRPDTPKPWVNIICPGDYGLAVSQGGSGYSWQTHASVNRINRWEQDLIKDEWGKYLYCRDNETGAFWSLGWQPVKAKPDFYECRHGMGYTSIESEYNGIRSTYTMFVPPREPLEIWRVKLVNTSEKPRELDLFTYMEWCLGVSPDSHREFHKLFIETEYSDAAQGMLATKRLWCIGNEKGQAWNRNWEFCAFHTVDRKPDAWESNKETFLGQYGTMDRPAALTAPADHPSSKQTGKWQDGIGSLQTTVKLKPGQETEVVFLLGMAKTKNEAVKLYKDEYLVLEALGQKILDFRASDDEIETIKEELFYAQNQLEKRVNASCYKKSKHDNHATDGW